MRFIETLEESHLIRLHELFQQEWWSKGRSLKDTKAAVSGSQIVLAAVEGEEVAGFVRVLTDYVFKAMIFDLIVARSFRGQNVGQLLVEKILKHHDLTKVRHFELYCLPELEAYYRKLGFTEEVGGVRLMRLQAQ